MGLVLTSKSLDASGYGLGNINFVAPESLVYVGKYGVAETYDLNLANGTRVKKVGTPQFLGEAGGCIFKNGENYLDNILPQDGDFTVLVISKYDVSYGPTQFAFSNYKGVANVIGVTLTPSGPQVYIPKPGVPNGYDSLATSDSAGFKTLVMKFRSNYVLGETQVTLHNKKAGTVAQFTPTVAGPAPAGLPFRIGSGYGAETDSTNILYAMCWNRLLTDEEIEKSYQYVKSQYAKLEVEV